MIAVFPTFYPDELVYSVLARYYVRSGYTRYIFAAEDLYAKRTVRPDAEFLNRFSDGAVSVMTMNMSMEDIILHHTMYPEYARFLQPVKRKRALDSLMRMDSEFRRTLVIPKRNDGQRYIRYCPVCAEKDRKMYGETYWHREHQLYGVNLCPKHHCRLKEAFAIYGSASPSLTAAEEVVPDVSEIEYSQNMTENKIVDYIASVFRSDVNLDSDVPVGRFLHSRLNGTKYVSARGKKRNMETLHADYIKFYSEIPGLRDTEAWELEKIFTGCRRTAYEVCLLAMFLGISEYDLVHITLPDITGTDIELRWKEKSTERIGKKKLRDSNARPGTKALDWNALDREALPDVKKAVAELLGDGKERPRRVTVGVVERMLGIPSKRIKSMPLCLEEINKNYEEIPSYWAREVVWAARETLHRGEPFNWKHVREKINLRRCDLRACIPYLRAHTYDEELIAALEGLLSDDVGDCKSGS